MKAKYRELIIALADNNMRVKPTARKLQRHYNTVYNQVMLIFRETGLDALDFYDLHKLVAMVRAEEQELCDEKN